MSGVVYQIEDGVLLMRAEGEYPPNALRDAWVEALADPAFASVVGVMLDARRSTSLVRRSLAVLRATADWFAVELSRQGLPCALLVDGSLRYGLLRMTVAWMPRGVAIQVFRNRERSLEWLGTRRKAAG